MRFSLPDTSPRGGRSFVGEAGDGRLERKTLGIAGTYVAAKGRDPGHADGDVDQPLAPGTSERVADDRPPPRPRCARCSPSRIRRADASGSLGKQGCRFASVDIGEIDPGVGADKTVVRFDDQDPAVHAHDSAAFPEDELHHPWIASVPRGPLVGEGGRGHIGQSDQLPLGLGNDLLGHHHHVARLDRVFAASAAERNELRDVVARHHFRQAFDTDELDFIG